MTVRTRTLHELDRAGRAALVRELGVADALRFLRQYAAGSGDYTAERHQWLEDDESMDTLFERMREAEAKRNG